VFTNGCFDLLHRGHVAYLYAARSLGDVLVVGVNTDASVRRLKGASRPVMPADDRSFVLAGLGCVDAVVLFDEDTPAALIDALLPDVLVKGGDYAPEDVVGRDTVEAHGGRLVLIPFVEGRSTTAILNQLESRQP
jgi:rfaE bifunctional protein nucleotidyltransferase chain/domain